MAYTDRYETYMKESVTDLEKSRESERRIVFGYTSDTDVLLTYDEAAFNEILTKYMKN